MIPGSFNSMQLANGVAGQLPAGLVLDVVPNAKTAFSAARRLRAAATYIFIAARGDSSSVATQTIGFTNDEVNEAGLTSFISSSTNARIREWADQSGNSIHADSGDIWGLAGTIYRSSAGGLVKVGGKLALRFGIDATENYYLPVISNEFAAMTGEYTFFMVGKPNNNIAQLAGTGSGNGGANSIARLGTTSHIIADSGGFDITTSGTSTQSILTAYKRGSDREIRVNGVAQSTNTTVSTRNLGINRIGSSPYFTPVVYHDGTISEVIFYDRGLSDSEIAFVEANMKAFYGIA